MGRGVSELRPRVPRVLIHPAYARLNPEAYHSTTGWGQSMAPRLDLVLRPGLRQFHDTHFSCGLSCLDHSQSQRVPTRSWLGPHCKTYLYNGL